MAHPELSEPEDRLGMNEAQWGQFQAYTHGFGQQDANRVDISLLRENRRVSPWERLGKMQQQLRFFRENAVEYRSNFQRMI